jgi:hypothetical protein
MTTETTQREWQAHAHVRLARILDPAAAADLAVDIAQSLAPDLAASVTTLGDEATVTATITADDPLTCAREGLALITRALADLGHEVVDTLALEAVDADLADARAEESSIPDLVTAIDAAKMLGVSRQRVHQLAAREDFPAPLLHLGGPIWVRAGIEAFAARWERRGGRPRSPQADVA